MKKVKHTYVCENRDFQPKIYVKFMLNNKNYGCSVILQRRDDKRKALRMLVKEKHRIIKENK